MTHLSIIIPAIGSQSRIDDTLVSVLENRPKDCEILIVRPSSYVDPYDLDDEVRFVDTGEMELLPQLNQGIAECDGQITHLLVPGLTVGPAWCDAALEMFEIDRNLGSVSPCIVARANRHTIQGVAYHVRCGKNIIRNPKCDILAPLVGTGFYRTSALRFMHGFDVKFGELADVELGMRLQSANYEASKCESRIQSDSKVAFRPTRGFHGGKLRGQLFATARRLGLSTSTEGWLAIMGEPLNNRMGLSTIGSVFGRAVSWRTPHVPNDMGVFATKPPRHGAKRQAA